MAGFDPIQTNRGTWRCGYCSHKSWKSKGYAVAHIKKAHHEQAMISEAQSKLAKSEREKAELQRRLDAKADYVPRPVAQPKKEERYSAVRYCPNCLTVDSVSIVMGQAVGAGGCFRCGNTNGHQVRQVNVNAGSY